MALNIGTLTAFLTVDDTRFARGVDNAEQRMKGLASTVKAGGQVIASGLTAGAAAVGALTAGLIKTGGAYNSMQQNSRAALQTLLGSQKAVNEQMAKLNALASKSPFSKSVFIQGQQQLLAFGFEAEKVIPTLDAVQNAVAATGGSSTQLADLIFVMAQIRAAGKITGQDLLQMGQRGVNAAELIGQAVGMSVSEVKAAISKNQIDAETALDAITSGMQKKFGGATDKIKKQWSGALDRIKAAWRDTGADIAEPFIDPNGGGQAVVWANRVADLMRAVQKHVKVAMGEVERRGKPAFTAVTKALESATVAVHKFNLQAVFNQLDQLTKYQPLIAGVGTSLTLLGLKPIPYIGALVGGIVPLVAGITALVGASGELDNVRDALIGSVAPAVPYLQAFAKTLADVAADVVARLVPVLVDVAGAFGKVIVALAPLAAAGANALRVLGPLAGVFAALVQSVAAVPAPVLVAVAAMVALNKALNIGQALKSIQSGFDTLRLFAMYATQAGAASKALGLAFGAFSGPVGWVTVAIGALVGALSFWATQAAENKARVDELTASLDKQTGAITENTRAVAYKQLNDAGAYEAARKLGITYDVVTEAALGNTKAQSKLAEQLKAIDEGFQKQLTSGKLTGESLHKVEDAYVKVQLSAQDLERVVSTTSDTVRKSKDEFEKQSQASRSSSDAMDKAADAAKRHADALQRVNDAQREAAAAAGDVIAAGYAFQDAYDAMTRAVEEHGQAVLDNAGHVDTSSKANRDFIEATRESYRSILQTIDGMAKQGKGIEEINAKRDSMIATLRQELVAWTGNEDAADAFIKTIGGIPEAKTTKVNLVAETENALAKTEAAIKEIGSKTGYLTIDGVNDPAMVLLLESLGAVNEGKGVFTIDAKNNPAMAMLAASLGDVNTSTGVMTIDAKNERSRQRLHEIMDYVNGRTSYLKIDGQDWGALNEAYALEKEINSIKAYIRIYAQKSFDESAIGGMPFADGGLVEFYAGGGVRRGESHVAQIAPAGAWRVWAEPETGGEAYIPLGLHKRARSREIMAEVARRFGDYYLPAKNVTSYGDGGTNATTTPTTPGPVLYFTQNIQQAFTKPDSENASEGAAMARLIGGLV